MAIFLPGPLIGAISGDLGSINFVQGKSGPYIRRKLHRTKTKSTLQMSTQGHFADLAKGWKIIGEANRQAWNSAATTVQSTNRLGSRRQLTGYQLFSQHQLDFNLIGTTNIGLPNFLLRTFPVSELALASLPAPTNTVSWTTQAGTPAQTYHLWGARSMSDGPTFHPKRWTQFARSSSAADPVTVDITADFAAELGQPQVGERFAVKVRVVTSTYRWSFAQFAQAVQA